MVYFPALSTGTRSCEVCGLSWSDIDLESRVISIKHSYDCFGNLKEPKTRAGIRRLPMPNSVHDALRTYKDAQRKYMEEHTASQPEPSEELLRG